MYIERLHIHHTYIESDGALGFQIVYHDVVQRNSYGIYINNATEAVAQCLAYDVSYSGHRARHGNRPRQPLSYQQCSTMIVVHLPGNSDLYIQGVYARRTLVARRPLSFWGIVKVG